MEKTTLAIGKYFSKWHELPNREVHQFLDWECSLRALRKCLWKVQNFLPLVIIIFTRKLRNQPGNRFLIPTFLNKNLLFTKILFLFQERWKCLDQTEKLKSDEIFNLETVSFVGYFRLPVREIFLIKANNSLFHVVVPTVESLAKIFKVLHDLRNLISKF